MASRWLRFIFQLPAMSGMRAIGLLLQRSQPRELLALEVLQAGAATRGDVAEPRLVDAQAADRRGGIAAADDRQRPGQRRDRLGDAEGAGRKRLELEHSHRAVPEHGLRAVEPVAEQRDRLRSDVETLATRRD